MALVLIADDDPMVLRLLEFALTAEGHKVVTAIDGQGALEMFQQSKPDIIFLDGMMPVMSGFDALKALKADKANEALPIVMMTAQTEQEDIDRGMALGAAEYIAKPFPPKDLVAVIERLLD